MLFSVFLIIKQRGKYFFLNNIYNENSRKINCSGYSSLRFIYNKMKIDIIVAYIQRYERGHEKDFVPPITGIQLAAITPQKHIVRVIYQLSGGALEIIGSLEATVNK